MSAADVSYLRLFKFYRPHSRWMQKNIATGIDMEVDRLMYRRYEDKHH